MALSYFDLDTRLISSPVRRPQPVVVPQPAPSSPPVVVPSLAVDASAAEARPTPVDLTDHSASYWVRRRRAEAQLHTGQSS